jgi:N-carbamoyl-L-amino-acid hydrolase
VTLPSSGDTVAGLLAEIADIGRDPVRGGWSRPVLSDAELGLREWFVAHAGKRGLRVEARTTVPSAWPLPWSRSTR